MAEFNVRFEEIGGEFGVSFRTEPGLPSQVSELNATANGTYDAGEDAAYNPVVVNVPNTYTQADEGKVVSGGALVAQTATEVTENGVYDTTNNNQVTVAVTGTTIEPLSVTENGTYTAEQGKAYTPVTVNVFQVQTYALELQGCFRNTTNYGTGQKPNIPKNISIVAPLCGSVNGIFSQYIGTEAYNLGIETASVSLSKPCSVLEFAYRNSSLKKIIFPGGLTITGGIYEFLRDSAVREVEGSITINHLQSGSYYNPATAFAAPYLEKISFTRNTLFFPTVRFNSPNLTNDTLVNIANALDPSASGNTLQHHATAIANCQSLMGTVSDGVFTADPTGSVTLADFITSTKGWTLA